jgi:hypothetical protein
MSVPETILFILKEAPQWISLGILFLAALALLTNPNLLRDILKKKSLREVRKSTGFDCAEYVRRGDLEKAVKNLHEDLSGQLKDIKKDFSEFRNLILTHFMQGGH